MQQESESGEGPVALASTGVRRQAEDWSFVLTAEQIPHRIHADADGFHVLVRSADAERAAQSLTSFEEERRPAVDPRPPRIEYGPTSVGLALSGLLLVCFLVQQSHPGWLDLADSDARAILRGQAWRAVTALLLHADVAHVAANALSCALFATLLFRALGPGLGALLMLLAGASANLQNAWLQGPDHRSIGASSAVFGAVGVLAGLQFAERWRFRLRRRQAWLPLAAGLGLFAMLGTSGVRTDTMAHLLGLLSGIPLGAVAGLSLRRPPRPAVQWLLLALATAGLFGAWIPVLWR